MHLEKYVHMKRIGRDATHCRHVLSDTTCKSFVQQCNEKIVPLTYPTPPVITLPLLVQDWRHGSSSYPALPSWHCVWDGIHRRANPIEGLEGLGDVDPTIGDNSRDVHMQLEETALPRSKPSNDRTYTTTQQLGNVLKSGEILFVTEACR